MHTCGLQAEPRLYFGRQVAASNRRILLDYALDKVALALTYFDLFCCEHILTSFLVWMQQQCLHWMSWI